MSSALSKLRQDARRHVDSIGKPVTVYNRNYGTISVNPTGVGYESDPSGNGWWNMGQILHNVTPVQTVVIRGIRDKNKNMPRALAALDYFVDKYLYTGPATTIWEKIPFSFVIDWFVDLSGVLDELNQSLTGTHHRILDASHSIKWDISIPIVKTYYNSTWNYNEMDGYQVGINNIKYYLREPIVPTYSVELNSRFGKRQFAHTSALLYEIVANLRKRNRESFLFRTPESVALKDVLKFPKFKIR